MAQLALKTAEERFRVAMLTLKPSHAHWHTVQGMVEVPLAAASALDPSNAAQRPDDPDCDAARGRRREAYRHVLDALRLLSSGSGNPGAAAAAAAGVAPDKAATLPPSERSTAKSALLAASLAASDTFFHACLFDAMIDAGETATLLAAKAPGLPGYLLESSGLSGGLSAAAAGGDPPPIGPLTPRQVTLGELLAKWLVGQRRFAEAAAVHKCLAVRLSGPGQQAVPLSSRLSALQAAVLQARSVGSAGLVAALEADARLLSLQATCLQRVQVRGCLCVLQW